MTRASTRASSARLFIRGFAWRAKGFGPAVNIASACDSNIHINGCLLLVRARSNFESQQQIPGDIIRALVYVLFARTTIDNDGAVSKLGCDSNLESSTSWSLPTVSGIIDSLSHNAHQAFSLLQNILHNLLRRRWRASACWRYKTHSN